MSCWNGTSGMIKRGERQAWINICIINHISKIIGSGRLIDIYSVIVIAGDRMTTHDKYICLKYQSRTLLQLTKLSMFCTILRLLLLHLLRCKHPHTRYCTITNLQVLVCAGNSITNFFCLCGASAYNSNSLYLNYERVFWMCLKSRCGNLKARCF